MSTIFIRTRWRNLAKICRPIRTGSNAEKKQTISSTDVLKNVRTKLAQTLLRKISSSPWITAHVGRIAKVYKKVSFRQSYLIFELEGDCPCESFDCGQLDQRNVTIAVIYNYNGSQPLMFDNLGK